MKKLFSVLTILIFASSCNFTKQATAYYTQHCSESKFSYEGQQYLLVKCNNMYDTTEVKKVVKEALVDLDIANASLVAKVAPKDTLDVKKLVYTVKKTLVK